MAPALAVVQEETRNEVQDSEDCNINDQEVLIVDNQSPLSTKLERFVRSSRNYCLEFVILSYTFAYALNVNISAKLILDRACTIEFNRTLEECNGNDTHLYNEVQKFATRFTVYVNLVRVLPSSVLGIFVGPWSDKYGRKQFIYFAMVGAIISSASMIWYASSTHMSVYIVILLCIPEGVTGNIVSVLGALCTLASVNTTEEARTFKYTTLQLAVLLALPLGMFAGGMIYKDYHYVPVYVLGFGTYILSLFLFLFAPDGTVRKEGTLKTKCKDFFSCDSLKENIRAITKRRENNGKAEIILLMICSTILILNYVAVAEILMLFCMKMFHWTVTYFSNVSTISRIGEGIAVFLCVSLLRKVWNISDAWMGILGFLSLFASAVLKAFSVAPWIYFVATVVGLPGTMATIAIRSKVSKITDKNDLGKVFSLLSIIESFVPLVGALMVTGIYNASVGFFPGLTIFVAGSLLLFPIGVFIWMISFSKDVQYHELANGDEPSESNSREPQTEQNTDICPERENIII